jgi:hypothetical protein
LALVGDHLAGCNTKHTAQVPRKAFPTTLAAQSPVAERQIALKRPIRARRPLRNASSLPGIARQGVSPALPLFLPFFAAYSRRFSSLCPSPLAPKIGAYRRHITMVDPENLVLTILKTIQTKIGNDIVGIKQHLNIVEMKTQNI